MQIALCQLNPVVGDVDANAELVLAAARDARAAGAELAVFPELALLGYPAEDLLLAAHVVARCEAALARIAPELPLPCVVGLPLRRGDGAVINAAAYVRDGQHVATYAKRALPNYAVFDEHRWFSAGADELVVDVPTSAGDVPVGVTICEDAWVGVPSGGDVVVNLSASPWRMSRRDERDAAVAAYARQTGAFVVLCNQVGGQDELVFDGHSVAARADGTIVARAAGFRSDLLVVDTSSEALHEDAPRPLEADVWDALILGLRDYVAKNGFRTVLLGLSGGIDSALVLALAVDALGADRVHGVTMPSRFSTDATRSDAHAQAVALGAHMSELPIEAAVTALEETLAAPFAGAERDVTEENLQARIRGTILMALSNKHGHMVLATGNKTEYAVGYATLYGDMNGGFAPLKDVPKTLVYRLSRWRNAEAQARGEVLPIPPSVIERPPTAELREGQLDSDSLPDYDTLDAVLALVIDAHASIEQVVAAGFDLEVATKVRRLVDRAEYKRRQAAPGVRITSAAFGRDRRVPITNRFDGHDA